MSTTSNNDGIAVQARGLTKVYGGTVALDSADLDVATGTVHGLVGENGAGKSTFAGILAGRVTPTDGAFRLFGEPAPFGSPHAIGELGLAMIYQELTILPALSTQANVFLGRPESHFGLLDESGMRDGLKELCERLSVHIQPDVPAGRLSVADQQILEIMRALHRNPRLIIFDEPTAALTLRERRSLLKVMAQLRTQGVTQVIVSHDLQEVLDISDHVTVFRSGHIVASQPSGKWTRAALVKEIHGAERTPIRRSRPAPEPGETPVLEVQDLRVPGAIEGVSISVRAGEILGLAGLVGAGRTSTLRALSGAVSNASGQMRVRGGVVKMPRTPRKALKLGIAMIPDDRKAAGIVPMLSAAQNIVLADYNQCRTGPFLKSSAVHDRAEQVGSRFRIPKSRFDVRADQLSGGTQQKLLFARWLHRPVSVLLADEPTRGIDVGAKHDLMVELRRLADDGLAVIVTSTEVEDLAEICDRAIVLDKGRVSLELAGAELSEERLREIVIGDQA